MLDTGSPWHLWYNGSLPDDGRPGVAAGVSCEKVSVFVFREIDVAVGYRTEIEDERQVATAELLETVQCATHGYGTY